MKPPSALTPEEIIEIRMRASMYDDPAAREDVARLLAEIRRLRGAAKSPDLTRGKEMG